MQTPVPSVGQRSVNPSKTFCTAICLRTRRHHKGSTVLPNQATAVIVRSYTIRYTFGNLSVKRKKSHSALHHPVRLNGLLTLIHGMQQKLHQTTHNSTCTALLVRRYVSPTAVEQRVPMWQRPNASQYLPLTGIELINRPSTCAAKLLACLSCRLQAVLPALFRFSHINGDCNVGTIHGVIHLMHQEELQQYYVTRATRMTPKPTQE